MPPVLLKKQAEQLFIVEKAVVEALHVEPMELRSKSRDAELVRARFLIWHFLVNKYGWSTVLTGKVYHRGHTAVLSGLKQVKIEPLADEIRYIEPRVEELERTMLKPV